MVDEFFDRYFDSYALSDKSPTKDAVLLAKDFDQLDKSDLKVELLRVMLQSKNNIEFLITTLPDPIDSYTGWQFDPMLEAITQAVSATTTCSIARISRTRTRRRRAPRMALARTRTRRRRVPEAG